MKHDQRGFSKINVIVIIILVTLLGIAGWFIYNQRKENTKTSETTTQDNVRGNGALNNQNDMMPLNNQQDSTQDADEDTADIESDAIEQNVVGYLLISEWGVRVPLVEVTKNATYRMENGYVYLDVAINGDANNDCSGQAAITKVANPDENADDWRERPSELDKIASKVNGVYYFIEGSQSMCSENDDVQKVASAVRTAWLKQGMFIIAE